MCDVIEGPDKTLPDDDFSELSAWAMADADACRYHGRSERPEMTRPVILVGCWPRRMSAEVAAAYCGEHTVEAFIRRVGKEYPQPRIKEGRRQLWLRDDLDGAILPDELTPARDIAEDL
jgi:hypothetical protein